ncbi:hypothetical protein N9Q05_02365 [bacterium]|nr:hypothetical protein [bacterium]
MPQNNELFQAKQTVVKTAITVTFETLRLIKEVIAENEQLKQIEKKLFENKSNDETVRKTAIHKFVDYKLANEFLEPFYNRCLEKALTDIPKYNTESDLSRLYLYLHLPDDFLSIFYKEYQDIYQKLRLNVPYQTAKTQFIQAENQIKNLQSNEERKWIYIQIAGLILLTTAIISAILIAVYVCPLAGAALLFTITSMTAIACISSFFMPKNALHFFKNPQISQALPDDDIELNTLLTMKPIASTKQVKTSNMGTFSPKKTGQPVQDAKHQKAPCC